MAKHLFGTDGIRGIPGTFPLDDPTLYSVGRALGKFLAQDAPSGASAPSVLIGRDTRESGPHILSVIASGLANTGAKAVSAGIITTPGVAWLVKNEQFAAGVVISASHNPYHDNGVKLISAAGMKFPDSVEAEIEALMTPPNGTAPSANTFTSAGEDHLHQDYLDGLRACVLPGATFAGMKILLDCANGAASQLAPALFRSLGADIIAINNSPDGKNINANCGSLHPEELQRIVGELGAALGVAFDGDADRALFVSASGKLVDGDGALLVAGRYLQSTGKLKGNVIVGTTMANLGLERALAKSGLKLARTGVGDRYVLEEMQRIGANLGGEQSGHILFLDDATTGDGMLTAIEIVSIVSLAGPLDALIPDLKIYPQKIVNVKVSAKPALETLLDFSKTLRAAEVALGDAGRVIVRYSGTEPLARVMVEAESYDQVKQWSEALAGVLKSSIGG